MRSGWGVAAAASALLASCAAPAPPRTAPNAPAVAAPASTPRAWRYDVTLSARGDDLAVDATIFAPSGGEFSLERGGEFITEMRLHQGASSTPIPAARDANGTLIFRLPPCPADGCRVRYTFRLAEAAQRIGEIGVADSVPGAYLTSPSAWLLHPSDCEPGLPFEVRVTTPPGAAFVAGLTPAGSGAFALPPAVYAADVGDLANPAWAAVGALHLLRVNVGAQTIDVAVPPGPLASQDELLRAFVDDAARAVQGYYGRAPIKRVQLVIVHADGRGMRFGRTLGNGGATIVAYVGAASALADLTSGWELIHELLHTSFPKLSREHAWLEEGMATYVEPLLRARRGTISAAEAFARFHQRMPFGLPAPGDRGLDGTPTWGRTYWGGALFCLLADLAIRERTGGRRSLDDALRAVAAQGGNVAERWEIERVIAVGDEATGTTVLRDLYAQHGAAPVPVDLAALWRRLGVAPKGDSVTFDDGAELAWIRRALVNPR